jgi:exosortase
MRRVRYWWPLEVFFTGTLVRNRINMISTSQNLMKTARLNQGVFTALVALSVLGFWKPIVAVVNYSLSHESSSHILLIPFVTVALLFIERNKIFSCAQFSLAPGFAIISLGIAFYIFALWRWPANEGNALLSASILALVLTWMGAFVLSFGIKNACAAAFPLLFLLLAVPFPDIILDSIVTGLQAGSTELTYLIFKLVRVPVLRQGFILAVPGVTIEVATECSGIRSTMALFITCLLAGHLFLRSRTKTLVFVLLAIPLAVIKNGIRIATLTLLSVYVDPGFLTGKLHHEGGFAFFLLALALLAPVLFFMERTERPSRLQSP